MKKLFIFAALTMAMMASCTSEDEITNNTGGNHQDAVKEFTQAFEAKFGKPAKNHNWGFTNMAVNELGTPASRNYQYNGIYNEANCVVKPNSLWDGEIEYAKSLLANNSKGVVDPAVFPFSYSDYAVQKVFTHIKSNGAEGAGVHVCINTKKAGKNNKLDTGNQIFVWTNNDSIAYVASEDVELFGLKVNSDDIMHDVKFVASEKENGVWYIGFNYDGRKDNDKKYQSYENHTDLILKIGPAKYKETYRVMCEDLGTSDDFDYNDVVFDVAFVKSADNTTETVITLQAAGGTLPIYIGINDDLKEAHELFGVSTKTMVNTGIGAPKDPVVFRVAMPAVLNANNIVVKVKDTVAEREYVLRSIISEAPQKIAVRVNNPDEIEWCAERENICDKYPKFPQYVVDGVTEFWK